MIRTKGRRRLTCYHEAGHCLARWYFGHLIFSATVLTVEDVRAGRWPLNSRGQPVQCEGRVDAYDILSTVMTPEALDLMKPEDRARCEPLLGVAREVAL